MSKRSHRSARGEPRASLPGPRPARPESPPRVPAQQSLLQMIADGKLDDHIRALGDAIEARAHLIHTVQAATALAALCVGDNVRINHKVKPQYLHGAEGRIVELDDDHATVCLHRPIGRFTSGRIRCPPLALDRLGAA